MGDVDEKRNLPAEVAVLKNQMQAVQRFMGRIEKSFEKILESIQKYAISEVEKEQDRKALGELAARLEKTFTELSQDVTKLQDKVDGWDQKERTRVERALRARLLAQERQVKEKREESAKNKAEWRQGIVRLIFRILETIVIAVIAVYVYHRWGLKLIE